MIRLIIGFSILLLAGLGAVEYLNFTGFCYSERRYLSDQELINKAVEYNFTHPIPDPALISYRSLDDFYQANPDCCFVFRNGHYTATEGTWVRVFGWYVAVAQIWYRRLSEGPKPYYRSFIAVSACGRPLSRLGPLEAQGPRD